MSKLLFLSLLVTAIATIDQRDQEISAISNDYSQMFTNANRNFSIRLYKELLRGQVSNLVVSPLSVSTLLTMLYLGARGETCQEIRTALGYELIPETELYDTFHNTTDSFKRISDCVLNNANSIWSLESFSVSENYKNRLVHYFEAEEHAFNFTTGLNDINTWVANKTNNKIPQLLREIPNDSVMLVLSAVYFKGPWKTPFNIERSALDSFFGNETVQTMFMKILADFGYHDCAALRSQILELPFKDNNITMIVILPDEMNNLEQIEINYLTSEALFQCTRNIRKRRIDVSIPKFEINSEFNLEVALRALGIRKIFGNSANLQGISQRVGLKVSKVIQKATFKVAEEEAEASAASAFIISPRSMLIPKYFKANRPFLYLLMHKPTDTILFMGRFSKPL